MASDNQKNDGHPGDGHWVELAESISDGTPIDWQKEEASVASAEDAAMLGQLRLVAGIAEVHRSVHASTGADAVAPRAAAPITGAPSVGVPSVAAPSGGAPSVAASGAGTRWGELELRERIGEGSFGEVYRAFDPRLEREIALKLIRLDRAHRPELAEATLREGRLLARLRHPNVVTVHGAEEHDGRVGLRMELLRGKNLEMVLREQGPLSAGEASMIGMELCRALAALHQAGLVHRDVKTQNVMREAMGRIVLMDLGVGQEIDELGDAGERRALAGTPFYMAPELLDGATATPASDLYSLGVILYRLVTARFPVEARRLSELKAAHASGEVRLLRDLRADLPPNFVSVIERCLAHEPARRFASAGELEQALAQSIGVGEERVGPSPATQRSASLRANQPTTPQPRRLASIAAFAALVLLASIAVGIALTRQHATFDITASVLRVDASGVSERLAPGAEVQVGDFLGLEVEGSRDLNVYVLTKDDQGESYLLFPLPGFDLANPLKAAMPHRLPGARGGKELFWQVSSAGGRERLLVLASPTRLKDLEEEIAAMPRPEVGGAVAAKLPASAVARLRGIGSLGEGPGLAARERAGDIFDAARSIGHGRERARGVWVREIELRNPGATSDH